MAEYLTLSEAAALLHLHPETLRRSTCPRSKVCRRLVFDRQTVQQWVTANASQGLAEVAA